LRGTGFALTGPRDQTSCWRGASKRALSPADRMTRFAAFVAAHALHPAARLAHEFLHDAVELLRVLHEHEVIAAFGLFEDFHA